LLLPCFFVWLVIPNTDEIGSLILSMRLIYIALTLLLVPLNGSLIQVARADTPKVTKCYNPWRAKCAVPLARTRTLLIEAYSEINKLEKVHTECKSESFNKTILKVFEELDTARINLCSGVQEGEEAENCVEEDRDAITEEIETIVEDYLKELK